MAVFFFIDIGNKRDSALLKWSLVKVKVDFPCKKLYLI